jgi:alkyldihydroxyacetonephosphate synthase
MNQLLTDLEQALPGAVRQDEATLRAHSRDTWVLSDLLDYRGEAGPGPLAVVEPRSAEEVAEALRICRAHGSPVVTYGGGSGVCGAIQPRADSIVLSTRRLTGLVRLDALDLTASFRSGTLGGDAERRVREDGLTIGHWPQSIELSTVGGWVATRASGQYSTAYGNIEDLVLGLEVVLPDGRILRSRETPRSAAGPDLRQLFLGSEGGLGVVTEVTFSLRELPAFQLRQAMHFESFHAAFVPVRRLMRAGWRPPVLRLYDARESRRHFGESCPKGRAMLILLHEGPEAAACVEAEAVAALCSEAGGQPAAAAAVDRWFEERNAVPGFRSFIEQGIIVDTIEVGATWRRITGVYDAVVTSLSEVEGLLAATAHTSHAYRSGANLYFTFAVKPEEPGRMAEVYAECWRRAMEATLAAGGGIAHHHGVGRVRRAFMERELGAEGVAVLRAIKRALDPDGLLNPGNLLPESEAPRGG